MGVNGSKRGGSGINSKKVLVIGIEWLSDQEDPTSAKEFIPIYICISWNVLMLINFQEKARV